MQKMLQALAIACTFVQVSAIAQPYTLSGSVKNQQGTAVVGASVSLVKAKLFTGTDTQGNFSFAASPVAPRSQNFSPAQSLPTMQLQQGRLSLQLATPVKKLQLSAMTLSGRQVAHATHSNLTAGTHAFELFSPAQLATEALVVTVNSDGTDHSLLVAAPQAAASSGAQSAAQLPTAALAAAAAIDTLRVSIGSVTKDTPVSSYELSGVAVVINYTPPSIPELPYKSIEQQKAAKNYFKSLVKNDYSAVFFRHQDDDVNKDVIGVMILTENKDNGEPKKVVPGIINDADIERLKDFPKLQAIAIQNQKLTDAGIAKLAQFPHLVDVRFHYMDLFDLITPNFMLPLNALKNLRVLEYKHNMSTDSINMKGMEGFPNLQRLILDNKLGGIGGAATDDGLDFATRCPNLQDFHFHRAKFTRAKFIEAVPKLTKLKLLYMRPESTSKPAPDASWVEGFERLTQLEQVNLDGEFKDDSAVQNAVKNKRPGVTVINGAAGAHVDRGYVLPVFTDFNKGNRDAIKRIGYMNL